MLFLVSRDVCGLVVHMYYSLTCISVGRLLIKYTILCLSESKNKGNDSFQYISLSESKKIISSLILKKGKGRALRNVS
jgi:hypothetical protein